ncbi:glycosyltransferase family 2 protein [Yeosuana marina]|uniref:glycosyltransferase family 2 protein n=1 Tax=Yeosuana marina TaxID=1565536 RepID=UPI00141FE0ED|nr:glycosyltransferase [Yeosuana marina]
MLSILIPTYNYNVYPLACQLEKQALNTNITFEIICFDDGSKSSANIENEKINQLNHSKFIALNDNIGLSNNRNALAKASKYEYLLFIDGDSILHDNEFILRYIKVLESNPDVIYGGRIHPDSVEPNRKLRWKYGKFIEDKSASIRKKNPYKTLMFNNTFIKKKCFNAIKFNPEIKKYGHEDTLFAYDANLSKLNVTHINNAVMHGDIDNNETFINKTERALVNILILYNNHKISHKFVKILWLYDIMGSLKLNGVMAFLFDFIKQNLKKQLSSKNPSLILFEIYKIGYLCSLKNVSKEI